MKKLRFLSIIAFILMSFFLVSCSIPKDDILYAPDAGDGYFGSDYKGESVSPSSPDSSFEDTTEREPGDADEIISDNQGPLPGQITAAAWSDHKNYDFWCSLFESDQENNKGLFSDYFTNLNAFNTTINTQKMITVKITDDKIPAINLPVTIKNANYIFSALTNVSGIAYLFLPVDASFPYTIEYNNSSYELSEYTKETIELSTSLPQTKPTEYGLDLMFVIDTTGSMGDELSYLKSEVKDVIESIDTSNDIRLSLLFYRDEGDQYVTRFFDFTTNIDEQIANINNQRSSGGGDFPEAVDVALDLAINQATWNEYSNKILIHVLDAPPHSSKQNINLFASSILAASKKGIRIIPVASSGIDKWTEFLLRTEALITGGTYTYITNHSGIGENHIDATVESVTIEYLNAMLVRLINEYYTGIETEPIPFDQTQRQ